MKLCDGVRQEAEAGATHLPKANAADSSGAGFILSLIHEGLSSSAGFCAH